MIEAMWTALRELWADLTAAQKWVFVALNVLIAFLLVSGWIDSYRSRSETRVYEKEAIAAKRAAQDAIERASKIAADIRIREEELTKIEAVRDEKQKEVDRAKGDVSRDRADYERAVRERRSDIPTTDQLCDELARLGYPCN